MSAGELILTHGLVKMDFALAELQSDRMGATGPGIVNELGTPRWMLQVETERLSQLQARLWSAWLVRRKGKAVTFTAWRLHRVNPYAEVDTPDGSIGLTINASASTITLTGLGVWAAGEGDMISYRTAASGFWCGEVTALAAAVAGTATIPVWPRPTTPHATPAVRRVQALAEFQLTTPPPPFEDYSERRLSFEAIQILR